jgi:DNA polymerase-3 subunit gamma/tau
MICHFIHKYQPRCFGDFEKTSNIMEILKSLVDLNSLYILLIGNTGSGKTTILNVVVREYYKESYRSDHILHINGLKEQGINYYRNDVKTFCQTKSLISGKKKIMVLDDIDGINEQSQQVFRNYIDKYSNNVHFIASSSSTHKVIENLQSRLMLINIVPISKPHLQNIFKKITEVEKIDVNADAEKFIIDICNNYVKKLINYLEKCKLLNVPITLAIAINVCTNINFGTFEEFTISVKEKRLVRAIDIIYSIFANGYSVMDILDNYFVFIKFTSCITDEEKYRIIPIICKYIAVFHNIHEDEIELVLFTNNLIQIL